MSAPKSRCPVCRLPWAEHVCDDDDATDVGTKFLRAMLGPPPGEEPTGTHVFRFPEEPDGEPPPQYVPFTIERDT